MRRTPIARKSELRRTTWGVSEKPRKPLPKINVARAAKRDAGKRAHYASKEYRAARREAMARAGGRCEFIANVPLAWAPWRREVIRSALVRCDATEGLQFHEEHYGSDLGLLREIRGKMYCPHHHAVVERRDFPHRHHGKR